MRRKLALCAAAVLAIGAGAAWYVFTGQARIARAKDAIRATMKDPDAVKFSQVRFERANGAVCGTFNAKNSYGAYVGFERFLFTTLDTVYMTSPDRTPSNTSYLSLEQKQEALNRLRTQVHAAEKILELCGDVPLPSGA